MRSLRVLFIYSNHHRDREIAYAMHQLASLNGWCLRCLSASELDAGISGDWELMISYGNDVPTALAPRHIHIRASEFFGSHYLSPESLPERIPVVHHDVPVLFQSPQVLDGSVRHAGTRIETDLDIVASTFFMLSRYEEVLLGSRDVHGRFPASASLAHNAGFIDRPVVHEYADLLKQWACELEVGCVSESQRAFTLCLTHDVDQVRLFSSVRRIGRAFLRVTGRPARARGITRLAKDAVGVLSERRRDPFDTFDAMAAFEAKHGISSTYFIMSGGSTRYDGRYRIQDVRKLLGQLGEAGHEIGLHGSYNTMTEAALLQAERASLEDAAGQRVVGNRQHYLRFAVPDTWTAIQRAGLSYDASLGYPAHEGFRAGVCVPFQPFDALQRQVLPIWEVPLVLMDTTLQGYRQLDPSHALESLHRLAEQVHKHRGVMTILWHNSSTYELEFPGWEQVLRQGVLAVLDRGAAPKTVADCVADAHNRAGNLAGAL